MKPPTRAPWYACMYHGLCEKARAHGYALAVHGSVVTDLDLIAVPWTDAAIPEEQLVEILRDHLGACGYAELLRRNGLEESLVAQILARQEPGYGEPEIKPHGRRAWNLYLDAGAKVDLSVMPRQRVVGAGQRFAENH